MKHFIRLTIGFLMMSLSLSLLLNSQASAQSDPNTNMEQAAQSSGSGFNKNAVLDGSAAAVFGGICKHAGLTGAGTWACPLAITSSVQAVRDIGSARESYDTAKQICANGDCPTFDSNPSFGDPATNPGTTGSPSVDGTSDYSGATPFSPAAKAGLAQLGTLEKQMTALQKNLADQGYTVDPVTGNINTPKGPISPDSLSSPSGMAAAGFTKSEIAQAMAVIQKVGSSYKNLDVGYAAGGGGAFAKKTAANEKGFDVNAYMRSMAGQRKPASADFSGLKKYVGSEPIGLAGDNIFEMVSRRYKSQAGQGAFLP